jgi:hypothetical protein
MERWLHLGGKYDLRVRLEFKAADFWIGVFAKRDLLHRAKFYDLWVCLVPMFPIHLAWDVEAPALNPAHKGN